MKKYCKQIRRRENDRVFVYVCVCERACLRVSVYVREIERERARERERERDRERVGCSELSVYIRIGMYSTAHYSAV